jgi:hypothetical protein
MYICTYVCTCIWTSTFLIGDCQRSRMYIHHTMRKTNSVNNKSQAKQLRFFFEKKYFVEKMVVSFFVAWVKFLCLSWNQSLRQGMSKKGKDLQTDEQKENKDRGRVRKGYSKEGDRCLENSSKDFAWFWPTVLVLSKPVVSFLSKSSSSEKKSLESNQQIFQGGGEKFLKSFWILPSVTQFSDVSFGS